MRKISQKVELKTDTKTLIAIVGPTAVGKTAVALQLAENLNTVILSADSRQFYKELSIGTAKPSTFELARVKHYFINSHQIKDNLSAGEYEREAIALLNKLFLIYNQVVLVGGSGLFVDAVRRGLDDLPTPKPGVRDKWNQLFLDEGITPLQNELLKTDPHYYAEVDTQNPQRLIRALEVWESTGQTFSSFRKNKLSARAFNTIMIGMDMERSQLYDRINERVDQMMEAGLLEEVRELIQYQHLPALKTVGYAELFTYLDGHIPLAGAIEKIKQNSRKYAKRQLTWFRKDTTTRWFHPNDLDRITAYINTTIRS